jgi:nucleoid DNA-binding protein
MIRKGRGVMAKTMTKSELIQRIVDGHQSEIARQDVKEVIEAVAEIGHQELEKTDRRQQSHAAA